MACQSISTVVIDTDSPIVIELTQNHFPTVQVLERPEHLRDGSIAMNDVLLNAINQIPADFYLQTHSTNPILTSATIEAGIQQFLSIYPMYDSLFTVTRKMYVFGMCWQDLSITIKIFY